MNNPAGKYWSPGRPEDIRLLWTSQNDVQGRPKLTSEVCPWEVDSKRPQDVPRTSPRVLSIHVLGTMCGHLLDVPKFYFTFLPKLIRLTKSI